MVRPEFCGLAGTKKVCSVRRPSDPRARRPGPPGQPRPLIEAVYIAPFDQQWVGDTVRRLLRALEHDYPVYESAI